MSKVINNELIPGFGYSYTFHFNGVEYPNIKVIRRLGLKYEDTKLVKYWKDSFVRKLTMLIDINNNRKWCSTTIIFTNETELVLSFDRNDFNDIFGIQYSISGSNIYIVMNDNINIYDDVIAEYLERISKG
jgi:hypothetical protein